MQPFRKILVGVDFSHAKRLTTADLNAPTQEAIQQAIWVAGRLSAQLTFFSALELSAQAQAGAAKSGEQEKDSDFPEVAAGIHPQAENVLAELVARAGGEGVEANSKLAFGTAWIEITREAVREQHELVIVGTRDLSAPSRLFLGSTGMKLLRNCPAPVWVAKPRPERDALHVLVATDLSDIGRLALDAAIGLGQSVDIKLRVLHAVEHHFDRRIWLIGLPDERAEEYRQATRAEGEQALREQLSHTDYRTLTYGVQLHVADGPADIVVPQAVEEYEIDLLVMGTVGRSGIPGVLLGNTAERIVPEVPCSILAIKPPEFQCPIALQ